MFKPLVVSEHKLLWSDDARIRKIAGAVPETIAAAEFKLPVCPITQNTFARTRYRCLPGFQSSGDGISNISDTRSAMLSSFIIIRCVRGIFDPPGFFSFFEPLPNFVSSHLRIFTSSIFKAAQLPSLITSQLASSFYILGILKSSLL